MTLNLSAPSTETELKPRIVVVGVGGAGSNAVNNMIGANLEGVDFVVANTDAQSLAQSQAERRIQLGINITHGLGAGARPDIGRAAAEEALDTIIDQLQGSHMAFITAGMGGGTGTGAGPVIARAAREHGILTVGVVTKPFQFEGNHRMALAEEGIEELQHFVDTLIVIPNQNLFRVCNEKTTFADAFRLADNVLYSGVRGVTDLMVMPGLINLDFADIRTVMSEMGKAMMGTGEASGERRAVEASESAISNPLLDDVSMRGARGVLINITGGSDMTLFEVDEAANRIREEVDPNAHIIFGSTFDDSLDGVMRVSLVATGIDLEGQAAMPRPAMISLVHDADLHHTGTAAATSAQAPAAAQQTPVDQPTEFAATARPATMEAGEPVSAPVGEGSVGQPAVEQTLAAGAAATPEPAPVAPRPTVEAKAVSFDEPFIAPRPAQPTVQPAAAASPRPRSGGPTSPGGELEAEKRRGFSLFHRVTGAVGARKPEAPEASVAQTGVPGPAPRTAPPAPSSPAPADNAHAQPDLGTLQPERPTGSSEEDDLLEIPAFLRRQAN